jgi:hypothetical protein
MNVTICKHVHYLETHFKAMPHIVTRQEGGVTQVFGLLSNRMD